MRRIVEQNFDSVSCVIHRRIVEQNFDSVSCVIHRVREKTVKLLQLFKTSDIMQQCDHLGEGRIFLR